MRNESKPLFSFFFFFFFWGGGLVQPTSTVVVIIKVEEYIYICLYAYMPIYSSDRPRQIYV